MDLGKLSGENALNPQEVEAGAGSFNFATDAPPTGLSGAPEGGPTSARLEDHTILNDGANPDFVSLNTTNWEGLTELAIY